MLESGKAVEFLEFLVLGCERDYSLNWTEEHWELQVHGLRTNFRNKRQ